MPKVYVYDSYDNKFFRYNLGENDPMPYSTDTTLRVREFRGSSKANVLWTTTASMAAGLSTIQYRTVWRFAPQLAMRAASTASVRISGATARCANRR